MLMFPEKLPNKAFAASGTGGIHRTWLENDLSDEEILEKLLALNLERSK